MTGTVAGARRSPRGRLAIRLRRRIAGVNAGATTVAAIAVVAMAGCSVGPDYHGPPDAAPKSVAAPRFVRAASAPVDNAAPPLAAWWQALRDPLLDALEQRALRASPTLDAAAARVRNARATLRQGETGLLPSGAATATALRVRLPEGASALLSGGTAVATAPGAAASGSAPSASTLSLYSVGVDATWAIDLFGGTRRQIEAAKDQVEASVAQFEDAQVMLTSDVATAYLNVRDNQNRLRIGEARVAVLRQILELRRLQRRYGTAADSDVENARSQLATAEADDPPLRASVQLYADQLAAYLGDEPGTLDGELVAAVAPPRPPAETAVGDPASLIRRRPDVRSAERTLAAMNAMIGANVAQYFPQLQLLGTLSFGATSTGGLLEKRNLSFIAGPSLSWNFLDIPATRAKVEQARAEDQLAEAAYRIAVLNALRDVENGLSQFGHQRSSVVNLAEATDAIRRTAEVYRERYQLGTASLIDALTQQAQYLQSAQTLAQNEARLTSYWVSLQSKLGLGWGVPTDGPAPPLATLEAPTAAAAPRLP